MLQIYMETNQREDRLFLGLEEKNLEHWLKILLNYFNSENYEKNSSTYINNLEIIVFFGVFYI